jgi:hypothetical protein
MGKANPSSGIRTGIRTGAPIDNYQCDAVDSALESLMPRLMAMSNEDYTRVLLQLSKSELIEQLQN